MRDIIRDWHRWSLIERVTAVMIGTLLTIIIPAAIVLNLYATMTGQTGSAGSGF